MDIKKIGLGLILTGLAAATITFCGSGCSKEEVDPFRDSVGNRTQIIGKGDTYWRYATELQKENPRLKNIDKRYLCYVLKETYNNGKELYYNQEVNLPR